MQLVVESWNEILVHKNGSFSVGREAAQNERGDPYYSKRRRTNLFIHFLDVSDGDLASLQQMADAPGRREPKGREGDWWMSERPKAFIRVRLPSGEECKLRASVRQLEQPIRLA